MSFYIYCDVYSLYLYWEDEHPQLQRQFLFMGWTELHPGMCMRGSHLSLPPGSIIGLMQGHPALLLSENLRFKQYLGVTPLVNKWDTLGFFLQPQAGLRPKCCFLPKTGRIILSWAINMELYWHLAANHQTHKVVFNLLLEDRLSLLHSIIPRQHFNTKPWKKAPPQLSMTPHLHPRIAGIAHPLLL